MYHITATRTTSNFASFERTIEKEKQNIDSSAKKKKSKSKSSDG